MVVVVRALVVVVVGLPVVVVALEVVEGEEGEEEEEEPLPVPGLPPGCWEPEKVDPREPVLTFENTTVAPGVWLSTSAGLPEVMEQVPRATPGLLGSASVG